MKQTVQEGFKRCSKCKEVKKATNEFFYVRKNSKDGFDYRCKECCKIQGQEYNRKAKLQREQGIEKPELVHLKIDDAISFEVFEGDIVRINKRINGIMVEDYFVGIVEVVNDIHFTVKHLHGYLETFLKVDFFIGESRLGKVV